VASRNFRIQPLSEKHDRSAFSCGDEALDRYLREQAGQDRRRHLSAVFVLIDTETSLVAGYYTLSACQVEPHSLPVQLARRLPRRPVPATLIGRLAVDLRYRGRGLGRSLLADALLRAATVSLEVASIAVIVDAKDEAARAFYEHHGFRRFVDEPFRLYLPIAEAIHAAGLRD
jgi:GNAT superfamily N-acetyltransferase